MRKIIFCIILYSITSFMRTYAIDFELSDIIKQARETEITKQKQIETDMKTTELHTLESILTEGIRVDELNNPIAISCIYIPIMMIKFIHHIFLVTIIQRFN